MSEKPLGFDLPGTLETPPMRLEGPVVDTLPESASIGDLITHNGKLLFWNGVEWKIHPDSHCAYSREKP